MSVELEDIYYWVRGEDVIETVGADSDSKARDFQGKDMVLDYIGAKFYNKTNNNHEGRLIVFYP